MDGVVAVSEIAYPIRKVAGTWVFFCLSADVEE